MKHDELTCRKIILECLIEYEEGAMTPEDRRELERHFSDCPPCGRLLSTYRATGKTLKTLKPREIPPALAASVLAFVKSRREGKK